MAYLLELRSLSKTRPKYMSLITSQCHPFKTIPHRYGHSSNYPMCFRNKHSKMHSNSTYWTYILMQTHTIIYSNQCVLGVVTCTEAHYDSFIKNSLLSLINDIWSNLNDKQQSVYGRHPLLLNSIFKNPFEHECFEIDEFVTQ